MNADEILAVVDTLMDAWPWAEWSEGTKSLWCDALEDMDGELGAVTARIAVRKFDRPPSIAAFLAEAHNEYERSHLPALDRADMSSCRECDGSGWVMVSAVGHGTYRRCSTWEDRDSHRPKREPTEVDVEGRRRFLALMREATAKARKVS